MNALVDANLPKAPGVHVAARSPWHEDRTWQSAARALEDRRTGLVLIPRVPIEGLEAAVAAAPTRSVRGPISPLDAPETLALACRELGLKSDELWNDCTRIAGLFFRHFQPAASKMRLEIIGGQPCPKFHCDHVFVRLICTYCGPATEYRGRHEQDAAHAFGNGWIGLLKGSKHPCHDGPRILHRSPPMAPGEKRLSFALDW